MKKLSIVFAAFVLAISVNAYAVDIVQLGKDLQGPGVTGWIHGAVQDQGLYVFTYRNPTNFFDYIEMSLVTDQPDLSAKLATYSRNDKVIIKGSFLNNPSPQKHVMLTSVDMVTPYNSGYASQPYEHEAKIPADLLNITHATFLVHAVAGDGQVLVLEYKDAIVPVFVKNATLTKNLYRNDIIEMYFKIQGYPGQPTHLNLDETASAPLTVVESIVALHGKPANVEGDLILFPKSPEIIFNVFAVEQTLQADLKRQYTLVNFDDADVFTKIRMNLQAAWDKYPSQFVNARNKLRSLKIRVRATGIFNETDPSQANPQILLKAAECLQIIDDGRNIPTLSKEQSLMCQTPSMVPAKKLKRTRVL